MPERPDTHRTRSRRRIGATACVAAVLLAGVAACGHDPSPDRLVEALVTSGIPRPQAECVVEAAESTLTDAEMESIVQRGTSGAPRDDPNVSGDAADRLRDAMAACQAMEGATTTTSAPETVPIDDTTTTVAPIQGTVPGQSTPEDTVATTGGASLDTVPTTAPGNGGDATSTTVPGRVSG